MSEPTERKDLPKGACGYRRSDGTFCTKPTDFKLTFFHFYEGTAPETRHRITVCKQHLDRTVTRVAVRYNADKIVIYPTRTPEAEGEAGAETLESLEEVGA